MRHRSAFLLGASVLLAATAAAHAFYVTVCRIDHNAETKSLEMTFQFFTDDLELVLRESGHEDLRLVDGARKDSADEAILSYVRRKFALSVNGERAVLNYVGKEVEINNTYVFIEVPGVTRVSDLRIRSTLLIEQFDSHATLVNIKMAGVQKSVSLTKDKEDALVSLQP